MVAGLGSVLAEVKHALDPKKFQVISEYIFLNSSFQNTSLHFKICPLEINKLIKNLNYTPTLFIPTFICKWINLRFRLFSLVSLQLSQATIESADPELHGFLPAGIRFRLDPLAVANVNRCTPSMKGVGVFGECDFPRGPASLHSAILMNL